MLKTAQNAAKIGGDILRKEFRKLKGSQIDVKGKGDYVTELDYRSEHEIISIIKKKFPDHAIMAEESDEQKTESGYQWIIDPLDGTANYIQGIPVYAVSIGIAVKGMISIGVIYCPETEEMFWTEKGQGAYLNGNSIRVSEKKKMEDVILATGFPFRNKINLNTYLQSFKKLFLQSAGIRRMGAAAVDLAFTACGILDGFWEISLKPWDMAAGSLLIKEAGGKVTDFQGKQNYMESGNIVAGSPFVHRKIVEVTESLRLQ
ncbi:MAG: inositol monophosphatase family protein [bacterium]